MATTTDHRPLVHLLTDAELEEFRALVKDHAGAELTVDEVRTVSTQLLRVLAVVREVPRRGSSASTSSVDGRALPGSEQARNITYSSP